VLAAILLRDRRLDLTLFRVLPRHSRPAVRARKHAVNPYDEGTSEWLIYEIFGEQPSETEDEGLQS
jgi:hypothetical protein